MRILIPLLLLGVLAGCPGTKANAPPCVNDNKEICKFADPTQLEYWEDEIAQLDCP
jgi:hypothetical protein